MRIAEFGADHDAATGQDAWARTLSFFDRELAQ